MPPPLHHLIKQTLQNYPDLRKMIKTIRFNRADKRGMHPAIEIHIDGTEKWYTTLGYGEKTYFSITVLGTVPDYEEVITISKLTRGILVHDFPRDYPGFLSLTYKPTEYPITHDRPVKHIAITTFTLTTRTIKQSIY